MQKSVKFSIALAALVAMLAPVASSWAEDAPLNGQQLFKKRCGTCHTVTPGDNRVGPSLFGVVGRESGKAPGYEYSQNNRDVHKMVWTVEELKKYLADPMHEVPGTKMTLFRGLKDHNEIDGIVAFLETQK